MCGIATFRNSVKQELISVHCRLWQLLRWACLHLPKPPPSPCISSLHHIWMAQVHALGTRSWMTTSQHQRDRFYFEQFKKVWLHQSRRYDFTSQECMTSPVKKVWLHQSRRYDFTSQEGMTPVTPPWIRAWLHQSRRYDFTSQEGMTSPVKKVWLHRSRRFDFTSPNKTSWEFILGRLVRNGDSNYVNANTSKPIHVITLNDLQRSNSHQCTTRYKWRDSSFRHRVWQMVDLV